MIKHYVTFCYPGSFFSETITYEVESRDIQPVIPSRCYGYRFHSVREEIVDGEILRGETYDYSKFVYFGTVMNKKDIREINENRRYNILLSNMECNGWDVVVKTEHNQFLPLTIGDRVITKTPQGEVEWEYK